MTLPLRIFSIVLDGMPWIERHLPVFQQLKCDWRWIICEGAAQNNQSTSWCRPQEPRLSNDGTHEYLKSISGGNVCHIYSPDWISKDQMVQAAISQVGEECYLIQCDVDEFFSAEQLEKIVELFESDPSLGAIKFRCNYWVGTDLVCEGVNCWSNKNEEWLRAWRFEPGMKVISHEPPRFDKQLGRTMEHEESRSHGLVFDHYSYVLEEQIRFKEAYYGYDGLLDQWRKLQSHKNFPEKLNKFFRHVDDKVIVKRWPPKLEEFLSDPGLPDEFYDLQDMIGTHWFKRSNRKKLE